MVRPALAVVLIAALMGCGTTYSDTFTCLRPDTSHVDANGNPDPCHENDAGTGGEGGESTCPGNCVPRSPPGWSEPVLLWAGPESSPPPTCPTWAPRVYSAGHADLSAPALSCGACSCAPASGSCALPETITAESQLLCAGTATTLGIPVRTVEHRLRNACNDLRAAKARLQSRKKRRLALFPLGLGVFCHLRGRSAPPAGSRERLWERLQTTTRAPDNPTDEGCQITRCGASGSAGAAVDLSQRRR